MKKLAKSLTPSPPFYPQDAGYGEDEEDSGVVEVEVAGDFLRGFYDPLYGFFIPNNGEKGPVMEFVGAK
jgi:hypothetical protein